MALSTTAGEQITLDEAKEFVKSFRERFPEEIKGSFIGAENVQKILAQEGCIGIRCYHGYDDTNGRMNLVIVGVDEDEKDMTKMIMNRNIPCPSYCDTSSALYNV